jgi:hypothetical protein
LWQTKGLLYNILFLHNGIQILCGGLIIFQEQICKQKLLNADDIRVWDYHDNRKLKVLSDLDERLDDAQILHLQNILVETKKADGTFPEDVGRSSSSDYYGNSSYYGSSRRPTRPGLTGLNNLGKDGISEHARCV